MTPNTTPAPMTHEGDDVFIPKPCCIMADGACFEKGECLSDCEALDLDLLRGASERELRQRLERAERDRNDWRTRADALAAAVEEQRRTIEALTMGVENLEGTTPILIHMARQDARIAEIEAGIGRLADDFTREAARSEDWGYDEAASAISQCANELRSLIGHKEG